MIDQVKTLALAHETINLESQAVSALHERIGDNFISACKYLFACKGRIVVIGMGKSSHIGSKIAATLASTGSPSFFVHPGEASHGDIGVLMKQDVVLAISYSGNTAEILTILPVIKKLNLPLITLTGNPASILAQEATVNLDVSVAKEACPIGLAPTSSTTTALVMGDALAVSLLAARGFTLNDFARSHPGGMLGKRLTLQVKDLMHHGEAIPKIEAHKTLNEALLEMTKKRLGMTNVVDKHNKLLGVFTDGDLRRVLAKHINIHNTEIQDVMTKNSKTIRWETLAIDALKFMEQHTITALPVVDPDNVLLGVIHMHDILRVGLV